MDSDPHPANSAVRIFVAGEDGVVEVLPLEDLGSGSATGNELERAE